MDKTKKRQSISLKLNENLYDRLTKRVIDESKKRNKVLKIASFIIEILDKNI